MIILRLRVKTGNIKFIYNGNICSEVFNISNEDFLKLLYYKNHNYHFKDWKKYRAFVKIHNDFAPKLQNLKNEFLKQLAGIPYE